MIKKVFYLPEMMALNTMNFKPLSHLHILILLGMMFQQCTQPIPKDQWEQVYFPLAVTLDSQIVQLNKTKPSVQKTIAYESESEMLQASPSDWQQELEVYLDADINRPILKGAYQVNEQTTQEGKCTTYTAQKTSLEVEKMAVWYRAGNIEKVEIEQQTKNLLFQTNRTLRLQFQEEKLTAYALEEQQQLLFTSPVRYSLSAQIQYE